ncbi:hypothetical protein CEUSTIGMA_g2619.t1 [Chlamydomonas eustigma]|uniref:EF-hand domain-containing protein n=1 Tax=Chlamydomonas eustigma TaxID=1157962 RepID=A0A250WWK3_9CHLO|nr:hypothetical protein CEUSTIGMA_g2619.t1 [Chlamydomonas eustigma]|eukprot:GAX75175.1 hypothetical protein CEUSTIGMA_g2619.t1 [Chlamydomonas eustigma]
MMDPRVAAEEYLEQHKIPQLLESLAAQLMFSKPEDPKAFMVKALEKAKESGTQSLLTSDDLHTMFSMFDITKRGVITAEQANNALSSILGPSADLTASGVEPNAFLTKDQFVHAMMEALKRNVPYKK